MIPFDHIYNLSSVLEDFRAREDGAVIYDRHMQGNYSAANVVKHMEMLNRHDPTGFAAALILDEMIESTISGSTVKLNRVLREAGFVESLRTILGMKGELAPYIDAPRSVFIDRLSQSLSSISQDFESPSNLEVAVCLRDAIHCIDSGLQLRWLRCDGEVSSELPLCPSVRTFDTMAEFTDALVAEMPFGGHLSCVAGYTVIGLKQPGRIGYLSKLNIDVHTGGFAQDQTSQYAMSKFDLDKPSERYPEWKFSRGAASALAVANEHTWVKHLKDLPRDRILWLAMVVEMTKRTMANVDPLAVSLADSMANALASSNVNMLPALRANYEIKTKSLHELFDACGFNEWTKNFLRPVLDRLTIDMLLPLGDADVALSMTTLCHSTPLTEAEMYGVKGGSSGYYLDYLIITSVSPHLVGTQKEVEGARNFILGRNLLKFLMAWGNSQISDLWINDTYSWFSKGIKGSLRSAVKSSSAVIGPVGNCGGAIFFYKQSPNHKTYNPRCWFNKEVEPTHLVTISPNNTTELIEALGLKSDDDIPEFLRGWVREPDDRNTHGNPFGVTKKWAWNNLNEGRISEKMRLRGIGSEEIKSKGFLKAYVLFNEQSIVRF